MLLLQHVSKWTGVAIENHWVFKIWLLFASGIAWGLLQRPRSSCPWGYPEWGFMLWRGVHCKSLTAHYLRSVKMCVSFCYWKEELTENQRKERPQGSRIWIACHRYCPGESPLDCLKYGSQISACTAVEWMKLSSDWAASSACSELQGFSTACCRLPLYEGSLWRMNCSLQYWRSSRRTNNLTTVQYFLAV